MATETVRAGVLTRPMRGRDPYEEHRASTPLELLFDLCFVVAVSQAANALHHSLGAGHVGHALVGYGMVFFAIWWAWMNFTWFASAYDTDDVPYRMLTLLQIVGVLILATGVNDAFDEDLTTATFGYVVMRVAMTGQWLRAAKSDAHGRSNALRYVAGLIAVQVCWVARLWLPKSVAGISFLVLLLVELAIPIWAERDKALARWHPEHIAERYGLFTIIVLGECILAAFVAFDAAINLGGASVELVAVGAAGIVIVFGLWWMYFETSADETLREKPNLSFLWGYAHYALFASIAALGAGLAVVADALSHGAHTSSTTAAFAVAVPTTVAILLLSGLQTFSRPDTRSATAGGLIAATAVIASAALVGGLGLAVSLVIIATVVAVRVAYGVLACGLTASVESI